MCENRVVVPPPHPPGIHHLYFPSPKNTYAGKWEVWPELVITNTNSNLNNRSPSIQFLPCQMYCRFSPHAGVPQAGGQPDLKQSVVSLGAQTGILGTSSFHCIFYPLKFLANYIAVWGDPYHSISNIKAAFQQSLSLLFGHTTTLGGWESYWWYAISALFPAPKYSPVSVCREDAEDGGMVWR